MKKKTATPPKPSRRKAAPHLRTQKKSGPIRKGAPIAGTLWDDDRAFRILVKNSNDFFTLVDSQGKILYRSPSATRVIHLPEKRVLQSKWLDGIWPEDVEEAKKKFALTLRSPGKGILFQVRIKNEAGAPRWVEGIGVNYLAESAIGAVLINYHDITDRKQQEIALQENERRYRELFERATLAIFQSTFDGKVIRVNPEFARMFGYDSPEEVCSSVKNIAADLFSDPARREEIIRLREQNPALTKFESLYRRKDGGTFWGMLNIHAVTDSGGRPQYFEGFLEDISERKRAEQALRESAEKFRSMFENSSAGVTLVGLEKRYRMVNPAFCEMCGYTAEELVGSQFLDITHPEDVELSRKAMQGVLDGQGKSIRFTKRYLHKDGHPIWADVSAALVYDADGKPSHFVTHILDTTDRRRAEEALRESEERYRSLFNHSLEGIGLSKGNQIIDANKALLNIFGYENLEEFRAIPLLDHVAPESQEYIQRRIRAVREGEEFDKHFTYRIIRKDGGVRDLEISTVHLRIGHEVYTHSTFRDITERKRAEAELHALASRHKALLAAIPEIVMEVDNKKIYIWANPAGIEFFGEDVIGKGANLYFEGAQDTYSTVQPLFNGGEDTIYMESWQHRKDGQKRLLAWWCRTLKDNRGEVTGALSSARDITERRQAEEALVRQTEELRKRNVELARLNELTERQMRRLIAMRAIDTAITSSFKLELVLNILLGQLTDQLGVHATDILIFQADLQTFRFCSGRGFHNAVPQQTFLRKAESYANQAAQGRRTIKVPRMEERSDGAKIYPKISGEGFVSYLCLPLLAKGLVKGVLEIFHREHFEPNPEEESFLEMVAGQAAIAIDNSEMFEGLQATNDELILAYNDTLTGWARTLELRSRETAGEAQRLADATVRLARSLRANEKELVLLYRGAILHDIGIMGIPDSILLKPGPLSEEEWMIVRKHPQYAHDLLSSINYLRSAIDIPYCHHERWDGSGYPRGLKGSQIPLAARIFAMVDVWDALRSDRPYRRAWTDVEAREYIRQQSGTLFDPALEEAFLEIISVR